MISSIISKLKSKLSEKNTNTLDIYISHYHSDHYGLLKKILDDPELIIKQDIEEGTQVAKGTNITLYIPEVITKYPDFTDGTWTESRINEFCTKYELKCTFKKNKNTEERDGTILSQSRPKGDKVESGADLTIKVAEKEQTLEPTSTDEIID